MIERREKHGQYVRNWLNPPPICSGGTETVSGGMKIHTFTSSGSLNVHRGGDLEVMVVGGGGGGASASGGGGGAGGLIHNRQYRVFSKASEGLAGTRFLNDANLVSYWKMADANDVKGANNGSQTGVTFGSSYGKFGDGGDFNGTSSKIEITDASSLKPTGSYTISCWMKRSSSTDYGVLFQNYNSYSGVNYGYQLTHNNAHKASYFQKTGASTYSSITGSTTIDDGNWHNIISVYDGSYIYLYVDGKSDATPVACVGTYYYTTMYPTIGTQHYGTSPYYSYYYDGSLDDIAIFSRALSAEEVSELYNGSASPISVIIGAGGTAAPVGGSATNGGDSTFASLIAYGGGKGGLNGDGNYGGNGGSGGGAGEDINNYGTGVTGQGNRGGASNDSAPNYGAGGGGGAGAVGGSGTSTTAGNGGDGLEINISGTATYYAGGGGGGAFQGSNSTGGQGGGGAGKGGDAAGGAGTANTGGGGGAGGYQTTDQAGGAGGSGIVIIRYPLS